MANEKVRSELKRLNVRQWKLAKLIGISEATLCRRFRDELPEDEQKRLIELIRKEAATHAARN